MATALLYSFVAVVYAFIILWNSSLDPDVIGLDTLPIKTITAATNFLFGAMMEHCGTFRKSKARDTMYLWSFWIWIGAIVCTRGDMEFD